LRAQPELAARVRITDTLGPSTIQPVVAARRLPQRLRTDLCAFLINLANDPVARPHLDRALMLGFEAVNDASYTDIRAMLAASQAAEFLTLRLNARKRSPEIRDTKRRFLARVPAFHSADF